MTEADEDVNLNKKDEDVLEYLEKLLDDDELTIDEKDKYRQLHTDLTCVKRTKELDDIRGVFDRAEVAIDRIFVTKTRFHERNVIRKLLNNSKKTNKNMRYIETTIESITERIKVICDKKEAEIQEQKSPDVNGKASQRVDKKKVSTQTFLEKVEKVYKEYKDYVLKKKSKADQIHAEDFDNEEKELITRLNGKDEDLEIITIIGEGGNGKTELARKIYDDSTIKGEFVTRAWVYVSQTYNKRKIYESILSHCTVIEDIKNKSDEEIAIQLCRDLEVCKYLIVIDNLPTKEAWNDLKYIFPRNKTGSRILITTRNHEVALHANPTKGPHTIKKFTQERSWELLKKTVFATEMCPSDDLVKLGVYIATKCGGLPLYIEVIASILLIKRQQSDWHEVAFSAEKSKDIIALGYNHLPYHLRPCFLYLGVFPENIKISVRKLIRLWIAEGFIKQQDNLSMEYTAGTYVDELVSRNLLIVMQRSYNGRIKSCRVHRMIYEFCKSEAQKHNFNHDMKSSGMPIGKECRRICYYSGVKKDISPKLSIPDLRSFLCFVSEYNSTLKQKSISEMFKDFELLRVLDIESITLQIFPDDLLQLVFLRYMAISCNVKVLPSGIYKLSYLLTLIFKSTSPTLKLHQEIWNMNHLRHLYTNASVLLPNLQSISSRGSENMLSLSMISDKCCTKDVLARFPNIKKLGVRGNLARLFLFWFENVGNLKHVTNLKLCNEFSDSIISNLPAANKFPKKLEKLTISNTFLDREQMRKLGELERLEMLKLKDCDFEGETWETEENGFRSLKHLHIGKTNLVTWNASKHHFPSLTRLVLQNCTELRSVPSGLGGVESFKEREIYSSNSEIVKSATEIQQKDIISGGGFKLYIWPPADGSQT